MFQYTRIRYYEYTTNHSSTTHVHMGPRETAAGSIYRNATMAVLYDRSQTFNPSASPPQPTATRYFLCRSSPFCLSLARPRLIVVRPIPVWYIAKTRDSWRSSSSLFFIFIVHSFDCLTVFFFSFDRCNVSLVIRLITLRTWVLLYYLRVHHRQRETENESEWERLISEMTERRPDRQPVSTPVPVYTHRGNDTPPPLPFACLIH